MVGKARKFQQRVTISLTQRDHERLERTAKQEEISISQVVRRAVRDHLERQAQRELALGSSPTEAITGRHAA
jgi:metal-responsive CopG/Arc/MetJ family transcriptional regulator